MPDGDDVRRNGKGKLCCNEIIKLFLTVSDLILVDDETLPVGRKFFLSALENKNARFSSGTCFFFTD